MPDFLLVASHFPADAVLGLESGSHRALRQIPWPSACRIIDGTHDDAAGYGYGTHLRDAIAPLISHRVDWNALL